MPSNYVQAREHGERLAAAIAADDLELIREDPITAIPLLFDIPVETRSAMDVASECSVAGSYIAEPRPHITVAEFLSRGRTLFTALHEFGHHLSRLDNEIQDWCFASHDPRAEEHVVDAFAAAILLPEELVDSCIGTSGPTAAEVATLFERAENASREACCVRAAQRLTGAGAVLVARGRIIQFASPRALPYAIARELEQDPESFFDHVAEHGRGRTDQLRIRFRTGNLSSLLLADAMVVGNYTFAVLVEHSPPWGGFSIRAADDGPVGGDVDCPYCDYLFTGVFAQPCKKCGERPCPKCRNCGCEPNRVPSRHCRNCNLELARATPAEEDLCEVCR